MADKSVFISEFKNEDHSEEDALESIIYEDYEEVDEYQESDIIIDERDSEGDQDDIEEIYLDESYKTEGEERENDDEKKEFYHCNTCDLEFNILADHIKDFHADQEIFYEVDENESTMKSKTTKNCLLVETQLQHEKTDEITFNCSICQATFSSVKAVSAHQRVHKISQEERNFFKKQNLEKKLALKKTAASTNNKFVCDTCNTIFSSSKSLKLHLRMHNPIKQKTLEETAEYELKSCTRNDEERNMFYCKMCDKSFDTIYEDVHMQIHNGKDKFVCGICNKIFANESLLEMHANAHKEDRNIPTKAERFKISLPYPCAYCGKEFSRPHEKVKHERIHTGEKPHECEICGKSFRVSYCLTLHMRTHTEARPFVCLICNKRFKAQSVYNHHLLTHSDVRGYQCPYCTKAFKTSVQLSGHKNSHTKPFPCSECNRPFATLYAVRAHMETHKRVNHNLKHKCHICGAIYARGFALKDHIKEQHGVESILPDEATNTVSKRKTIRIQSSDLYDDDFEDDIEEIEIAGQSILPLKIEGNVEVTLSEIDHFVNEEVVTDWLK